MKLTILAAVLAVAAAGSVAAQTAPAPTTPPVVAPTDTTPPVVLPSSSRDCGSKGRQLTS